MAARTALLGVVCTWMLAGAHTLVAEQFSVKTWTVENGLPQNIIRGITQTPDGYLWIATLNGIARFDGVRFVVFDKSNTAGIASNRFAAMVEDKYGDLWLPSEDGGLTRYHGGEFRGYGPEEGLPARSVRSVTIDPEGNLWVLAQDSLFRFDHKAGSFNEATPANMRQHAHPLRWDDEGFWAQDTSGLHVFTQGRVVTYRFPAWLSPNAVWDVGLDRDGTLWLETFDGIQAFAASRDRLIHRLDSAHSQELSHIRLGGHTWTERIGPHLDRTLEFQSFGRPTSLGFRRLFQDREGNLWAGTEGDGLSQLREEIVKMYSKRQGLAGEDIYPVYEDKKGTIWLGAWPAGLSAIRDDRVTNYTSADGLPGHLVSAIEGDQKGRLWVATHGGLVTFQNNHFARTDVQVPNEALVQAILEDRGGTLWLGTSNGLIVSRGGPVKTIGVEDGLAGNDVKAILESRSGDIWTGGYGGLTHIHGGQITHWTEKDGLPSNNIRSLHEDVEGALWIGTYDGGLARFKEGKFTTYNRRVGLFDNGVFQILDDGLGNLWMSSNRGIYSASKRALDDFASGRRSTITCVAYGKGDGMSNVECNGGLSPAGIKARDGRLWFPTQEGVAVINPRDVRVNRRPAPVMIEAALVEGKPSDIGDGLIIPPGKENVELDYTALSFIHSDQIQFAYRLEGLDSHWVDAGSRRTAYYSHIPPGKYTFHVIAANSDGVWNDLGKTLPVTVLAPFYETWWFISLEGLVAAMLVVFAIYYRLRQLQEKQATQKAFSQQLIASQEKERQRIAAELHDSLGQRLIIINNLAQLYMKAQRKLGAQNLDAMEEISGEVGQAIQETRDIAYNLRPFQLDRLGLTKAIQIVLRTVENSSGLRIVSELDNIDDALPKELRIHFYRIIQESMNNVMKHAQATEVSVAVKRTSDHVLLTVHDNGVGFSAATKVVKGNKGGFGLTGMEERAYSFGGIFRVRSVPGQGTTMTVEFPIQTA